MVYVKAVTKPKAMRETMAAARPVAEATVGSRGSATAEVSRSERHLAARGRSGPILPPFESVIGVDERTRILDTELFPWRMICALRMHGAGGSGALGTGWFIGPKTVLTAGHCVHSTEFFGGWASVIEVIPGLNGPGTTAENRPFGSITSESFSSTDRWQQDENPDFDIGCIHLDESMGDQVGWFRVGSPSAEDLVGFLVNVSGYPADRGQGNEQYHGRNRILRVTERRMFYETDTYGGQSGAPAWIYEDGSEMPLAVGIHAYGIGGTLGNFGITANSAPRIIPEVLNLLTEWVEQDGGWPTP